MAVDWLEVLGWTEEQLEDLRVTGYRYLSQGHYERALIFFDALVALNPDSLFDLQVLGALCLQLGNAVRALEVLEKVTLRDPVNEIALLNKAKALLILGNRREGLILARELAKEAGKPIKGYAEALVLAYQ
ncbi:MAG: type III secretion chaperone [Parachlamydiales bacterium]